VTEREQKLQKITKKPYVYRHKQKHSELQLRYNITHTHYKLLILYYRNLYDTKLTTAALVLRLIGALAYLLFTLPWSYCKHIML